VKLLDHKQEGGEETAVALRCNGGTATAIGSLCVDGEVFDGEVFLDAFEASFATVPGLLDATEGCRGVGDEPAVDPDHPDIQCFRDACGSRGVAGEEVGDQAVGGVVGNLDGFGFGAKGVDRGDRSEYLFVTDACMRGDVGQEGGLEKAPSPVLRGTPDDCCGP